MARKSWIARDKKRRNMVAKYAERRRELKRAGDYEALQRLPRDASPVRVRNRCVLSGRSRGYMRKFGVSRIVFRDMALHGRIPGVRKASW
jgi:small subunit ribosomal protein S14